MKEFVENLLPYERNLFFMLNGSESTVLDNIMHTVSLSKIWIPLYVIIAFLFFYKAMKKSDTAAKSNFWEASFVFLFFIAMFALCDQFSSGLIKPFFERLRPGHHPDFKDLVDVVNGHRGGGFSFISGHATNCTGFAVLLSLVFRNRLVTLVSLTWAALISYSRIYLGMHFISDVAGGILAGTLIAVALYAIFIPLRKKIFRLEDAEKIRIYSQRHGNLLALVFAVYFAGVIVYSLF